jgi:serine/threonine-protein kinase
VLYEMLTGDVPFHGENQVAVAMKHVREDLPDVQLMRPEVSARLAAVLDRMTDKDLAHRHPDAATLEADLEDALAAEAARTGTATGEATAVLRTLPADARRRLPLRLRLRVPALLLIAMIAVAGAVLYLMFDQAAERAQKGTGTGSRRRRRASRSSRSSGPPRTTTTRSATTSRSIPRRRRWR